LKPGDLLAACHLAGLLLAILCAVDPNGSLPPLNEEGEKDVDGPTNGLTPNVPDIG
jgi:hypothetical protein